MMSYTVLALFFVFSLVSQDVTAVTCNGRPHLQQGHGTDCFFKGHEPEIEKSVSCIAYERETREDICTAASCMEANIKLEDDIPGSEDVLWSFSACYQQEMDILICDKPPPRQPEQTSPPPPQTSPMGPTTTTAVMPTTTTDVMPTTTTDVLPTLRELNSSKHEFKGCYEGHVRFDRSICGKQKTKARLTKNDTEEIEVEVQIVGCCDKESKCRPEDDIKNKLTCIYSVGKSMKPIHVPCDTACASVLHSNGTGSNTHTELVRGCMDDVQQALHDTEYEGEKCDDTFEEGSCKDISDEEICVKCCKEKDCNVETSREHFLKPATTTEAGAECLLVPSFLLMIMAYSFIAL